MVAEPCGSAASHRRPPAGGAESAEFVEKRNLLSVARCIVTNVEQEADEQQADSVREFVIKVEDELQKFRHGILVLMDKNLIPSASTGESKMTHYTRVSDYNRYLAGLAAVEAKSKVDKNVPVVLQRQVPVIQQVLKTVEVPQVQYVDEIIEERIVEKIDVPVPHVKGEIIGVVKQIPQERLVEETGVRVPRVAEKTVEVPQVQFHDRVVEVLVVTQRQDVPSMPRERIQECIVEEIIEVAESRVMEKNIEGVRPIPQERVQTSTVAQKTAEIPQVQFIDSVVDASVVQQRQVPTAQTVQKTTQNPRARFLDEVVGMPVLVQHKVAMVQRVQKTVEVPQIQYIDKIVEAPVAAAQQPVPVDAESLRAEEVSVGTQTVCRKWKLSTETESAESADGTSDTEHGLVQEGENRREMDETRERHAAGEDLDLLLVAPNMEAGGSHLQAMTGEERIEIWTQDLREIRRMVEFPVRRERKLDVETDVAIRRLERLEKENLQLEDEALEASLPEALADKTQVVKLLVDKWFVDTGFGCGKIPSGEVVFIHASAVQDPRSS